MRPRPLLKPLSGCYVESWLTAFPPFMVGVPELFLERCLSSISWRDGSLYIQTGGQKVEGKAGKGGGVEKMDVETETRSGGRLEGQLYQVDGDKMKNLVSTFFLRLPANHSRQFLPVQRVYYSSLWLNKRSVFLHNTKPLWQMQRLLCLNQWHCAGIHSNF